jgi:hypothetical protein
VLSYVNPVVWHARPLEILYSFRSTRRRTSDVSDSGGGGRWGDVSPPTPQYRSFVIGNRQSGIMPDPQECLMPRKPTIGADHCDVAGSGIEAFCKQRVKNPGSYGLSSL